jgi:tetratricopeptide (TPR) repeat protein
MSKFNSVPNQELLNAIVKLLEQKNYNLALQTLEKFFQNNPETNTKEYLYARVLLLDAYLYNGSFDKAINLCQKLSNSKHQTTQILAQYYLAEVFSEAKPTEQKSSLNSTKNLLTSAQATELIHTGYEALIKKRYKEAIRALKICCQAASPATKEYLKAHKLLIKAYQENGQINQAIAFCQQLLINEHEPTRKWARQLLFTDLFTDNIDVSATSQNLTKSEVKLQTLSETLPEEPELPIEKFTPKTLKEFKIFCQKNLLSELKVFESRRKQVLLSIVTAHLIFLSLVIVLLRFFTVISPFLEVSTDNSLYFKIGSVTILIPIAFIIFFFNYLLVFLFLFWAWLIFYSAAFETFSSPYKSKIPENIFNFIHEKGTLRYINRCSPIDIKSITDSFDHSQLFQGIIKSNNIIHDNYIYGKINGVDIYFSNIRAESELKHYWINPLDIPLGTTLQEDTTYSNWYLLYHLTIIPPFIFYVFFLVFRLLKIIPYIFGSILQGKNIDYKKFEAEVFRNKFTRASVVFKGLFFKAKFNKNLRTVTIVQPKFLNANINTINHAKKQLIKLEDPEFAKLFTVYGDDQIEARYVLSTNLMDKIVNFRKKTNRNIYISFVDDMIYIAIEEAVENNIFEPNLYKSVLSFAPLREYFETLNLMLGIVEDLNLDRRI